MYEPFINTMVVKIDDSDAKWGTGNDDSMMGKSFRQGTVVSIGPWLATKDYPSIPKTDMSELIGKDIRWNQGVEAGTEFDHDGSQYGMIYWWDIRATKIVSHE